MLTIILFIILIHFVIGFVCSIYFISHPNCFVWDAGDGTKSVPMLKDAIALGNLWICLIICFIIYKLGRLYAALVTYFANKILNKED